MNLKYRPFAAIGFTTLISLFLIIYTGEQFAPIFMGLGALGVVISLMFRKIRERLVPLYIAGALIFSGFLYYAAKTGPDSAEPYIGETAEISGVITDNPTYSDSRYYYILDLNEINGNSVDFKLRLSLPSELHCDVYDTVTLNAKIYEIAEHSDKIKLYYYSKGIFLGAYSYNEDFSVQVEDGDPDIFQRAVFTVKETIVRNISDNIHGENGATVIAMLLGDKSNLSDERTESFREAGISPIFAVSGLHLSIWVLGLFSFLKALGMKKRLNSIISIFFTVFFMFLTGLSPSVCRSGIMMILLLIGNLFYRKTDSVNSLGFVAFLLCFINPYIAVDTGFLLSFSATLGIVTVVPLCKKYIFSKFPDNLLGKVLGKVLTPVAVGISASIAVLPFTIILIGEISVLSAFSNLLLSYIAAVCMVTGGLAAVLCKIPFVSDILFAVAGALSKLLLAAVDFICTLPVTLVSTENLFWKVGAIVSVAVIIFALFNFNGKNVFKAICIGLAANIIVFSLSAYFYYDGLTQVRILNVGNGISVVVYCEGEKIVLTGEADEYSKKYAIDDGLSRYNKNACDLLLLADNDAANDFSNLTLMAENDFERIVIPKSNQSVDSLADDGKVYEQTKVKINVFDDDYVRFCISDSYSLALCQFNDVSILFLFDSYKRAEIPQEYLDADYFVCRGYIPSCISPESYKKVIVCGEEKIAQPVIDYVISRGGSAQSMQGVDTAMFNIREESHKIILLED